MIRSVVINKVEDITSCFGIEIRHPHICITELEDVQAKEYCHIVTNIYTICCSIKEDGTGEVFFLKPGNSITTDDCSRLGKDGCVISFHPDLLTDTLLVHRLSEYSFFDYAPHDTLSLNAREMMVIAGCIRGIGRELTIPTDRHTKRIMASGIAVLLSYCLRFYDMQHAKENDNNDLLKRLNMLLNNHLARPINERCELPTVAWCAEHMRLSANYFGDLIKRQANRSAQDIIHQRIIAEARMMLDRGKYSISEIAYHLGFKYPHHLSRVFKRLMGITPNEYRQQRLQK